MVEFLLVFQGGIDGGEKVTPLFSNFSSTGWFGSFLLAKQTVLVANMQTSRTNLLRNDVLMREGSMKDGVISPPPKPVFDGLDRYYNCKNNSALT